MTTRKWTTSEIEFVKANIATLSHGQIAQRLGRTCSAVKAYCEAWGFLKRQSPLTEAELGFIRAQHGKMTARQVAQELGCTVYRVHNAAHRLGLGRGTRVVHGEKFEAFVREKHALGWSDTEIAAAYSKLVDRKVDRHSVKRWRVRLGLPAVGWSVHLRRKVAARTREQIEKAGLPSIGYLRVEAFRKFARDSGWPEDLQKRETQILNLMWQRGPMTKREIVDALGMPWKGSRKSLCGNRKGGSYLATLMRRGMVICLGRIARHANCGNGNRGGQGKNSCVYSLSPSIQRRKVANDHASEERLRPAGEATGCCGAGAEPGGGGFLAALA